MKDIKTVLLLCSTITILFISFYFQNKIVEINHAQLLLRQRIVHLQEKELFVNSYFELNSTMTGMIAPDIHCKEFQKDSIPLSVIAKEGSLLIYRFTERSCQPCYVDELNTLQQLLPEKCDYILLLCSYNNIRDFMIFKNIQKIKIPTYFIPSDTLNWKAEESGKPYYFVLHPDMKISHIYVPDKNFPEQNKHYLEGVKRFLSEKDAIIKR